MLYHAWAIMYILYRYLNLPPDWWKITKMTKGPPVLWLPSSPLFTKLDRETINAAYIKKDLVTSVVVFMPKKSQIAAPELVSAQRRCSSPHHFLSQGIQMPEKALRILPQRTRVPAKMSYSPSFFSEDNQGVVKGARSLTGVKSHQKDSPPPPYWFHFGTAHSQRWGVSKDTPPLPSL